MRWVDSVKFYRCPPKADIGRSRPVMLDAVSICVQYDVGGSYIFCTDDLRHRQHNGRRENYFSNRLQ